MKHTCWILGFIAVILLVYGIVKVISDPHDAGEYDYCVEWEGLGGGTLHRDAMLYNCYGLSTGKFFCDYRFHEDTGVLEVNPILNTTMNDEGEIVEIVYDKANYFNCTRWLKSKR